MLLHRVSQLIDRNGLLAPEDKIIIGVSGGPDSMALLYILAEIHPRQNCIAVYVDHGLRPLETGREIDTVRDAAGILGIVFFQETIAVTEFARGNGCSVEEAARILRYRALETHRRRHGTAGIAVAHTEDDQVEEFFVRLSRGSGLKGLSGMKIRNGKIIRPLLFEKKQTLLHYLEERGIPFCLDSSNQDRRFLRNRVRLDLLPALERHYNPAIRQTVLQTMEIFREEDDLLDRLAEKALNSLPPSGSSQDSGLVQWREIPLKAFLVEHPALQRRILDTICWQMDCRPGFRQIDQLLFLMHKGENGGEVHLQGGLRVKKVPEKILFFYPAGRKKYRGSGSNPVAVAELLPEPGTYTFTAIERTLTLRLERLTEIHQPAGRETLILDAREISFPLQLRSIAPGQRFKPFGARGSKKVNRFLNDRKIPERDRGLYPALFLGDRIIALPGLEIDHAFQVTSATETVLVVEWRPVPPGAPTA